MSELAGWIDKYFTEISNTPLFQVYFSDIKLEKIEDQFILENLSKGIDAIFTAELRLSSIHLYSEGYMKAQAFNGHLPCNLLFSFTRKQVEMLLGTPTVSGGGHSSIVLGYVPAWDKYYLETYSIHLTYSGNGSIILISIGTLKFEEDLLPE